MKFTRIRFVKLARFLCPLRFLVMSAVLGFLRHQLLFPSHILLLTFALHSGLISAILKEWKSSSKNSQRERMFS